MNQMDISIFIEKAITKTNSHELDWFTLPNHDVVKRLPSDTMASSATPFSQDFLRVECSYASAFKTGHLLLLVYSRLPQAAIFAPPDKCLLSLRIQDAKSKYAVEIANSQRSPSEATALIRLYNLIDKNKSSLRSLVDDFLNS